MVCHIFTNSTFTYDFIVSMEAYFSDFQHEFIIYGGEKDIVEQKLLALNVKSEVVVYSNKRDVPKIIKKIYKADRIILHSLFLPFDLLLLFYNHKLCKKTIPVLWGGDLYDTYKRFKNSKKLSQKCKTYPREMIRRCIFRNVASIAFLTPSDFESFKCIYNYRIKYVSARYCMQFLNPGYMQLLSDLRIKDQTRIGANIMIGHCAHPSLQHIRIMNDFKRYSNIRIYVPLSYGNTSYKEEILSYGLNVWQDHFYPVTDFMDATAYAKLLSDMDMIIIYSDRQIGLGNIYIAVLLGKIICVAKASQNYFFLKNTLQLDVIVYEDFMQAQGSDVFHISKLRDEIDIESNIVKMQEYVSKEKFYQDWWTIMKGEQYE